MNNVEHYRQAALDAVPDQPGESAPARFDPAPYRADIDQFDISEQQKQELLTMLWSIMRSFVELGFRGEVAAMVFSDINVISNEDENR